MHAAAGGYLGAFLSVIGDILCIRCSVDFRENNNSPSLSRLVAQMHWSAYIDSDLLMSGRRFREATYEDRLQSCMPPPCILLYSIRDHL